MGVQGIRKQRKNEAESIVEEERGGACLPNTAGSVFEFEGMIFLEGLLSSGHAM